MKGRDSIELMCLYRNIDFANVVIFLKDAVI